MKTVSPFLHPQLERVVFEILPTIYSYIALFDVCPLQEWLSYESVDSKTRIFFIVFYLEGK